MFRLINPSLYRCNGRNLLQLAARFSSGPGKVTSGSSCGPSPGPSKKPNPGLEKIKQMQKLFQKDDGKPIHLKGGSRDLMLYRVTWGLALLGLLLQIHMFAIYIIY
ncbi:cytochrome c oxidase subunit 7A-related protein, mitochondrial-like [Bactrocera tryoni]|uniref:cytochrome c oxidase subunit 7A-related protein, mitochondrial-like n=1 Tax=Bactrocera tryoni TaxID=59916 RepID=UPI001A95F9CA|nr:cytochrome c oxidase subunit 7A-related protein, mitochondrial-like [Bactrocera tryoni]